jgi:hypothetical protein
MQNASKSTRRNLPLRKPVKKLFLKLLLIVTTTSHVDLLFERIANLPGKTSPPIAWSGLSVSSCTGPAGERSPTVSGNSLNYDSGQAGSRMNIPVADHFM